MSGSRLHVPNLRVVTSAGSRLFAQVDFCREMRPIAFVDPGAFADTYPVVSTEGTLMERLRLFARQRHKAGSADDKVRAEEGDDPPARIHRRFVVVSDRLDPQ